MKVKTALKKSKSAVPFEAAGLGLALAGSLYSKAWQFGAIAALVLVYLAMDVSNIVRINRRLVADPTYADREKTDW